MSAPAEVARGGVTTARDLAWVPDEIFPLAWRSRDADFVGPTIYAAGPMLTIPGGYPIGAAWAPRGTGRAVRSLDEVTAAVSETAGRGAAVVKVALNAETGPTLPLDLLRAVVDDAHGRALRVTAHAYGRAELSKALDAGVDELAHMLMSPERISDDVVARMVGAGMTVVPTLAIRSGNDRRVAIDNLSRFVGAGGRVVYGTDLGNEGPRPGIDPVEIHAMVAAGLSARDILGCATVGAAGWLGLRHTGVLAPGKDADIVGVRGRPDQDAGALARVEMVFRKGRRLR